MEPSLSPSLVKSLGGSVQIVWNENCLMVVYEYDPIGPFKFRLKPGFQWKAATVTPISGVRTRFRDAVLVCTYPDVCRKASSCKRVWVERDLEILRMKIPLRSKRPSAF